MENGKDFNTFLLTDFKKNMRPVVKLFFYNTSRYFGPGTYSLLTLVQKTGSLRAACAEMGMSYSKSLNIIKNAEDQLGCALVKKTRGGFEHGSTTLTDSGECLLAFYDAFNQEMQRLSLEIFDKYAEELFKNP